jgi:hypothetical protein
MVGLLLVILGGVISHLEPHLKNYGRDHTPLPTKTALPEKVYWTLTFGCFGVAVVFMLAVGAAAVWWMMRADRLAGPPVYENVE